MTKLELQQEHDASQETKELYDNIIQQLGKVPNIYQVYGYSAAALKANLELNDTLSKGSLSQKEKEIISLVVSQINGCEYRLAAHTMLGSKGNIAPVYLNELLTSGFTNSTVVEVMGIIALNVFNNFTNNLANTPVDFPIVTDL